MKILYFDCFSGAAGDMLLGAFLDSGLPLDDLRRALGSLGVEGYELAAEKVLRAGVSATKFRLIERDAAAAAVRAAHGHSHAHTHRESGHRHHEHGPAGHHHGGHQAHRTLHEICHLIDHSALSPAGKDRAKALFTRLAETEAEIHQMPIERVHLHEVGALDSIIDIVGVVFAFEWVKADRVVVSALNVGSGTVQSAHGVYPVPAPATVRLLKGIPIYASGPRAELLTPTGALLLTGYADEFGAMPAMRVQQVGYGAGDRDFPDTPNVVRLVIGESAERVAAERLVVLECEIDDMNPQIFGVLMDRLYAAGALEVFFQPVQMKKNRPGTLVTVLAAPERTEDVKGVVFRETTTIGIRHHEVQRERLEREAVIVETAFGPIRFKVARRAGAVTNAAPEFDDCVRAAAEHGVPVKDVQAAAAKAWLERPEQ
ncbi:MAG TPA: nickel pincer cofactor biosynthesis protein LarC [Vicinamibacterales bacterium]|nr:nickel pincer cofactor biosynthesis protein LarC [Vicinamibacterales bacterium]